MRNWKYGLAMAKWGCHILLLKSDSKLDELGEDNNFGALEIDPNYIILRNIYTQNPHRTSGKNSGGMCPVCLGYLLCPLIPPLLCWHGGSARQRQGENQPLYCCSQKGFTWFGPPSSSEVAISTIGSVQKATVSSLRLQLWLGQNVLDWGAAKTEIIQTISLRG